MNQPPENETEAIRSEIDTTRRRMDNTMDALGERLKGRHLLDEVLGFFRGDNHNSKAVEFREKVSRSASTAAHSIADTVKANPMPALLIGAGIAWMIYSSRKSDSARYEDESDRTAGPYDPDASYDRPLDYSSSDAVRGFGEAEETGFPAGGFGENYGENSGQSKLQQVKVGLQEKASEATQQVKEKLSNVGDQVRQKSQMVGQRAREVGARVQARTREVYVRTRERVTTTADQHPLEVGIACLAAGVAVGLAVPTAPPLNRVAGPTMDRLRQRTRDASGELLEKGKRVVNAAGSALKTEAEQQGLTFENLRQKAGVVADRAKSAATDVAHQEGMMPGSMGERPSGGQSEPTGSGQPSGSSTIAGREI
ncbi:MAG: DUF3618 domain-containing protein [Opitutaceae bacterium]